MELTRKDRVVLINQYRILKRLDPDSARHYDELIEILERGYAMFYARIGAALQESEIPEEVARFVEDVFALYRAIEAYKSAHPEDQDVAAHLWATFPGFDSASEADHLIFARFLADPAGGADGLDSHAPTLSKYRIMLAVHGALGAPGELCAVGVRQVLGLDMGGGATPESSEAPESEPATGTDAESETDAPAEDDEAGSEAAPKPARKRASRSKT